MAIGLNGRAHRAEGPGLSPSSLKHAFPSSFGGANNICGIKLLRDNDLGGDATDGPVWSVGSGSTGSGVGRRGSIGHDQVVFLGQPGVIVGT